MFRFVFVILCIGLVGCSDDTITEPTNCAINGEPTLDVGVPDRITFLDFAELEPGGDIPLSSNGQTFLAVQLAVRGSNIDRVGHIGMTVTYQPAGGPSRQAVKDDSAEEPLFCRENQLYHVPVVVSSEMLGNDIEIQDQSVEVEVTITDRSGRMVSASASGVLRRF